MILVDTNVWAYSIRDAKSPITAELRELLRDDKAVSHDFVHGELSMGKGGSTRKEILDLYAGLKRIPTLSHDRIVAFVKKNDLAGKGMSYIDAHLLAAAYESGALVWTEDKALKTAAKHMDIAYKMTKESA